VPYLDARWVAAKPDPLGYLKWVRGLAGMTGVGLYLCDPWQWNNPIRDPEAWADYAYNLAQHECAPGTSGSFPSAHLNYEQDDAAGWLLPMLRRWRAHSPRRTTAFVVNAHKWPVYAAVAPAIAGLAVSVVPECFSGSMERVESAAEVQGWAAVGGSSLDVYPMLDGAQLGAEWDGVAFTMGHLP
jgi:hypothetical protein